MTLNLTMNPASLPVELAELVERLVAQVKAGEPVELDALIRDHPDHADELRGLLPAVQLMADLSVPEHAERLTNLLPALKAAAALDAAGDSSDDGPRPNVELGDFRIVRQVGRGGMGIVYEAEQLSLRRRVALKVLPFASTMDPKQLQRFRNEALAAASLHHEHIVPVYAVGCERGVHYYAMQFIEGTTLAQAIAGRAESRGRCESGPDSVTGPYLKTPSQPRPPDTAPVAALSTELTGPKAREFYRRTAELIADAADALEYAHSLGIVHRDIKPGNLMVDGSGKIWVADFGLARFGPDAGLTMSGDLLGTLRYMAPEQALARHGLADHRVDVYGLGCTLCELLTGKPAVGGIDKADILRHLAFEEPVAPRKFDKHIPAELETIALKCLAKNPNERYATAGELAADLRRFCEDKPIKAKPPTMLQRSARRLRRHPRVLTAAFAIAVLAAIGATMSAVLIDRQKRLAEDAHADARAALHRAQLALEDMSTLALTEWMPVTKVQGGQREYLKRAAEHNDWLATQPGVDIEARASAAAAMFRAGRLRQILGQAAAAHAGYNGAIDLYEGLAVEFPDEVGYRRSLAMAYHRRGLFRDEPARETDLRRAMALNEQIVSEFPSNAEYKLDLAMSMGDLARHYQEYGRLRDARAICERATAVIVEPTTEREQWPVAQIYSTLGYVALFDSRWADSERAHRREIELLEPLVRNTPGSITYRFTLVDGLFRLAECLENQKSRPAEALDAISRAIGDLRPLIANFTTEPKYQRMLALCSSVQSQALADLGRYSDAEAAAREAVAISEKLVAGDASVMDYKSLLAHRLSFMSEYYSRVGQYVEAEAAIRRAIATYEQIKITNKNSRVYQSNLAMLYHKLALNYYYWGRLPEADSGYRKSMELDQRSLSTCNDFGLLLKKMGRFPEAEATLHRGIEVNPNDGPLHNALGSVYEGQEKYELAATSYRRATAVGDDPTPYTNLGKVLRILGRYDEALAYYRRGHELSRKLPAWYFPTARWLRDAERLAALAPRLPALLSGQERPADAGEQIAVARVYQDRKRYAAAVRCYADAFAVAPSLPDELASYRFDAACAAALAGCGQGDDAAKLDDAERARLRRQALDWLTADLGGWAKLSENSADRPKVRLQVEWWNNIRDLGGVREATSLAKLPEAERITWENLWADVDHLLKRVTGPLPGKSPPRP
jgi:serine/threonine protein kinase/tetratricopeptide (TPR) repeat protein